MNEHEASDTPTSQARVSRRSLLRIGGAAGIGGIAAGVGGALLAEPPIGGADASQGSNAAFVAASGDQQLAFHGAHQSGPAAPAQAHAWLTAFDLTPAATRARVIDLMRAWSAIASAAMAVKPLPGGDDAMAGGRGPGALSVTIGFGASLLSKIGLSGQVPGALAPLPAFVGDRLDPAASDGDLLALVAGNDALVVVHALRALQRTAAPIAVQRWQEDGFAEAPGIMPSPNATQRNLMGQIDGTANPRPGSAAFDQTVYVPEHADPAWMRGGTYLVYRRIRMLLTAWDALDRAAQEAVIGRSKSTGAPLSGGGEFTPADFTKQNPDGSLAIPAEAHIRQASAQQNNGATILRRPFSYYRGTLPDGGPNAGLLFLAYQADPRTGFIPIQQRLAEADTLSTFIRHEASGLYAIPPGCPSGGYLGQDLLEGA
jgi:dye decolorizing peroxidase